MTMKPKVLFTCKVADIEAKKRIEQHAEIIELDECTEQNILDNVAGCTALIVPYSANMVVTKKVIDAGIDLKTCWHHLWWNSSEC